MTSFEPEPFSAGARLPDPPAPTGVPSVRPLDKIGNLAVTLIVLVAAANVLYAGYSWRYYELGRDFFAGAGVTESDMAAADGTTLLLGAAVIALWIAAPIAFIVWLWRARANAEVMCGAEHTRRRGWVIGSWFCPIVNLWFPLQVVRDVWKASNPDSGVPDESPSGTLKWAPGSQVLAGWWATWLVMHFADQYSSRLALRDEYSPELLERIAAVDTVSAIAGVAAAVLIIIAMRQITRWQSVRGV